MDKSDEIKKEEADTIIKQAKADMNDEMNVREMLNKRQEATIAQLKDELQVAKEIIINPRIKNRAIEKLSDFNASSTSFEEKDKQRVVRLSNRSPLTESREK